MTKNLWWNFSYENVEAIVNQEDLSPLLYTSSSRSLDYTDKPAC